MTMFLLCLTLCPFCMTLCLLFITLCLFIWHRVCFVCPCVCFVCHYVCFVLYNVCFVWYHVCFVWHYVCFVWHCRVWCVWYCDCYLGYSVVYKFVYIVHDNPNFHDLYTSNCKTSEKCNTISLKHYLIIYLLSEKQKQTNRNSTPDQHIGIR